MKRTPYILYFLLRKIFALTGGRSNDALTYFIQKKRPYQSPEKVESVLGALKKTQIQAIADDIRQNGYHFFDVRLSEEIIDRIYKFSSQLECSITGLNKNGFKNSNPGWPRYDMATNDLIQNEDLCRLILDPGFKSIAGEYLGSEPICDLISMWWSCPSSGFHKEAAQMYHFDMDRIKFLKFFFYLTDVTEDTGPHCFIEGSHRTLPLRFRRDGRFRDEPLLKYYSKALEKRFVGKRGSIIAVDTRGFHKGEPLVRGERLIFQIEFSNSLFGMNYPEHDINKLHPDFKNQFFTQAQNYLQIFGK
jgi:hypothetical protein